MLDQLSSFSFPKYIKVIVFTSLAVSGYCKAQSGIDVDTTFGVWEMQGDTMLLWQGNKETILTITIEYFPPLRAYKPIPHIQFTLIDSSITDSDIENLDFGLEYGLVIPSSFDLLAPTYKSRIFRSSPQSFYFHSIHEVYCDKGGSVDNLIYEFYNRKHSKQIFKYTFDSKGIGKGIKEIACNDSTLILNSGAR